MQIKLMLVGFYQPLCEIARICTLIIGLIIEHLRLVKWSIVILHSQPSQFFCNDWFFCLPFVAFIASYHFVFQKLVESSWFIFLLVHAFLIFKVIIVLIDLRKLSWLSIPATMIDLILRQDPRTLLLRDKKFLIALLEITLAFDDWLAILNRRFCKWSLIWNQPSADFQIYFTFISVRHYRRSLWLLWLIELTCINRFFSLLGYSLELIIQLADVVGRSPILLMGYRFLFVNQVGFDFYKSRILGKLSLMVLVVCIWLIIFSQLIPFALQILLSVVDVYVLVIKVDICSFNRKYVLLLLLISWLVWAISHYCWKVGLVIFIHRVLDWINTFLGEVVGNGVFLIFFFNFFHRLASTRLWDEIRSNLLIVVFALSLNSFNLVIYLVQDEIDNSLDFKLNVTFSKFMARRHWLYRKVTSSMPTRFWVMLDKNLIFVRYQFLNLPSILRIPVFSL